VFLWSQEAVKKIWSKIWIFHGSKVVDRGKTVYSSCAAEEEIAKQFPTELWRVLKFSMYTSILHIVVIIPDFRGGTLFQTRIIIIHMCSLLI
jgi:hypothetical protein